MTGEYLRVKRNEKWVNIEVEHLTIEERKELFKERSNTELLAWMDLLCEHLNVAINKLEEEGYVLKRSDE